MNKNTLFWSASALCLGMALSCQKHADTPAEAETPTEERLEENEIDGMLSLIGEVSACIDSIQIQEHLIYDRKEGDTDRTKMLVQLRSFKDLLAEKQARIDSLTAEKSALAASSKKAIQDLEKMTRFISSQLAAMEKQTAALELALQNKDAKIDELRYGINELSKESEYLKEQNYQQDKELNTVYYIVATKKELKGMGLLKSNLLGKKLKSENIDKTNFKEANRRSLKQIAIDDKTASVLTAHPADSYQLTAAEDGTSVLEITDAEKFWSISPFLIIQK